MTQRLVISLRTLSETPLILISIQACTSITVYHVVTVCNMALPGDVNYIEVLVVITRTHMHVYAYIMCGLAAVAWIGYKFSTKAIHC